MAGNRTICTKNQVDYSDIRKAMCQGARSAEEVKALAGTCNECEGCKVELPGILSSVCGCNGTSLQDVIDAVNEGAKTSAEVTAKTGAGAICGRCVKLIDNIIELGR